MHGVRRIWRSILFSCMKRIYIYISILILIFLSQFWKKISHFCIHVLVLLLRLSSRMFKSSPLFKNNSYISNDGDRWSIVRVIYAKVENSVSQSRVNAAERFLREAGHAIVAADCHLVWHAKLSPFLPLVYSSSCTTIHHPSLSWLSLFQLHVDINTSWTKGKNSHFFFVLDFFQASNIQSLFFSFLFLF